MTDFEKQAVLMALDACNESVLQGDPIAITLLLPDGGRIRINSKPMEGENE